MKQKEFINQVSCPKLAKAVISQFGGWEAFTESAEAVYRHGIDGGFGGFVYYSDTVPFAEKHRSLIVNRLEELADDLGLDVVNMVSNFGPLRGKMDDDDRLDLYRYLSLTKCKGGTIPNLMAWFAAEEICREYTDLISPLKRYVI